MLVLNRKRNEDICIGENIVVTVVDIRGDTVRIGVSAPKDIAVDRSEIRAAKQRSQNTKAGAA